MCLNALLAIFVFKPDAMEKKDVIKDERLSQHHESENIFVQ